MSRPGPIVVLGATGQQGGAVARHLLAGGWKVWAFVRNPLSPAAKLIEARGARLVVGNMEDAASLQAAFADAHGVFSVQPPSWSPDATSDAREVALGQSTADAARRAGVRHFVYTSVIGAQRQAEFGRTFHKYEIERYVWMAGLAATVLRPAGFMENFLLPAFGIANGTLIDPTDANIPVPLIGVDDIGAIAAKVFDAPDRFIGRTLDLAGDRLTPPQIATRLSAALNRFITHVPVSVDLVRAQNETLGAMYAWLNAHGYPEVDIPALRAIHPDLMSLEAWLASGGTRRLAELGASP